MLNPEQLMARLAGLAVSDVRREQEARSRRLSGRAADAARLLLADPPSAAELGGLLDELSDSDRELALWSVHPRLAPLLGRAWVALGSDPYLRGSDRFAFRAPGHPEVTRMARVWWLLLVLGMTEHLQQPPVWFATWARPEGWDAVERSLLSARREEGLRQVILEAVHLGHPAAFRRMLHLVVDHQLTRFPATVRAASLWLGERFDMDDRRLLDGLLPDLARLLDDPAARAATLRDPGPDPGGIYLALWAGAFDDAVRTAPEAARLLSHQRADHRLAAARVLAALDLPAAVAPLVVALADGDRRVVAVAAHGLSTGRWAGLGSGRRYDGPTFAALRGLLERLPRAEEHQIGLWTPRKLVLDPATVADSLVLDLGDHPPVWLAAIAGRMSIEGRHRYTERLAADPARHRAALLAWVGDRAAEVRQTAVSALAGEPPPTAVEARELERLLRRRGAGPRRGVVALLLRQPDDLAAESAQRLRQAGGPQAGGPQAAAGDELMAQLIARGRAPGAEGPRPARSGDPARPVRAGGP